MGANDRRRECAFHGLVFSIGWHEAPTGEGETVLVCAECESRRRYHESQLSRGPNDPAPAAVALLALQWPDDPPIPDALRERGWVEDREASDG